MKGGIEGFSAYIASLIKSAADIDPFNASYKEPNIKFSDKSNKLFSEPHRELKEFSIQGNKVMAYSRKDAITRLKAIGKLKRKR